jgi:hypothetical protein
VRLRREAGLERDVGLAAAAADPAGAATAACLWWTYFDGVVYVLLARITEANPQE